jgi:uroporphyrinogen-III decarboxylase
LSGGNFLETLAGKRFPVPPIWLMRQAGRFAGYRAIRAKTVFLELAYTDKAVESRCSRSAASASMRRSSFPTFWWCPTR